MFFEAPDCNDVVFLESHRVLSIEREQHMAGAMAEAKSNFRIIRNHERSLSEAMGQIGVSTTAESEGSMIGSPAASE